MIGRVSGRGTRAIEEVQRAGAAHQVHGYEPDVMTGQRRDGRPAYGREAAAALGVAPDRIFKTLIVLIDGRPAAAIVPVAGELDLKRFAEALGARRAVMAEPAEARRVTGYVVGGISPLGQRRRLATVLDASALDQATVFVSAGRRGLQLELAPAALVELTRAIVVPITRSS
jgi:Cys-tRNA(Pro)/Cys-tRNA(Cys) deacylase